MDLRRCHRVDRLVGGAASALESTLHSDDDQEDRLQRRRANSRRGPIDSAFRVMLDHLGLDRHLAISDIRSSLIFVHFGKEQRAA